MRINEQETLAVLPLLYAPWIEAALGGPIPAERKATCDNCAMCRSALPNSPALTQLGTFNPRTKCCTYLPTLWNFLVGRILEDESPEGAPGRVTVDQRIEKGIAVSPFGLEINQTYDLLYSALPETFGHSSSMRCPHYIDEAGGLCGIWRHRNAVCATWFCKHDRGAVGVEFWERLRQLLRAIEVQLAKWCVTQLRLDTDAMRLLALRERLAEVTQTGVIKGTTRAEFRPPPGSLWGSRWRGRERQFYCESARLVSPLSWVDVLKICGPDVGMYAELAKSAYVNLKSDTLAERLQLGQFGIIPEGDTSHVYSYSSSDMMPLPASVVGALSVFDGQHTTDEAIQMLFERTSITVDDATVHRLADMRVLLSVDVKRTDSKLE